MNLNKYKLILASQSPRRKELLSRVTPHFKVQASSVTEAMTPDLSPTANVIAISKAKALWVFEKNPSCFIIGADTIVTLGKTIFGKPKNLNDAHHILKLLSGKVHEVITGLSVINPQGICYKNTCKSKVEFHQLSQNKIDNYVKTGESFDKAGAYGIQGQGKKLIKSYQGSYFNIMGLPLEELRELLARSGFHI